MEYKVLLCIKCLKTNCDCDKRFQEEIDNNMLDIIVALNKKGYRTSFCCGGHEDSSVLDLNIVFQKNYNLSLPEGFKNEVTRWDMQRISYLDTKFSKVKDRRQVIDTKVAVLREWAEGLPILESGREFLDYWEK